jgi:hypothetical protein
MAPEAINLVMIFLKVFAVLLVICSPFIFLVIYLQKKKEKSFSSRYSYLYRMVIMILFALIFTGYCFVMKFIFLLSLYALPTYVLFFFAPPLALTSWTFGVLNSLGFEFHYYNYISLVVMFLWSFALINLIKWIGRRLSIKISVN